VLQSTAEIRMESADMRDVILPVAFSALVALIPTVAAAEVKHGAKDEAWKLSLHKSHATVRKVTRHPATHTKSAAAAAFTGSPYTIENLIARVELNPGQFARFHGLHYTQILLRDIQLRAGIGMDCTTFNGLVAPSAYHRFLKFRRSLDPARFDHFHPILGPILAEDDRLRTVAVCPSPPSFPPPSLPPPSPGGITDNGNGNANRPRPVGISTFGAPPTVPEPSGVALILIGFASVAAPKLVRRYRNRVL
jgi:hypothetical protein